MYVVFVGSEAVPFAKTGGLGDVLGALPAALANLGLRVSLILPLYREIQAGRHDLNLTDWAFSIQVGEVACRVKVWSGELPSERPPATAYFVDHPASFDRKGLYQENGVDYPDNAFRFLLFSQAAIEICRRLPERPDVIHCHDWQAAMIPALLAEDPLAEKPSETFGTLLTIHNVAYQGSFKASAMDLTGLDPCRFHWRDLEFRGRLNFLKAGLVHADLISTVSPTYAREIQTPRYGNRLEGVLAARRGDLRGIVNGIDVKEWSPAWEPMLARNYDRDTFRVGKAACKRALQNRVSLPERPDVPLFAQIGRFDPQKGWDLLLAVADDLLSGDVQMVVLGQGEPGYRDRLQELAHLYPGKIATFVGFDETLAHQIEAGADLFLMPSLYEPCGLNQLYSMVHGTVPLVRATGGLADTVVDVTPSTLADGTATGFTFRDANATALREALRRALDFWPDRPAWDRLIINGMKSDWSWRRSAKEYVSLYNDVREKAELRRRVGSADSKHLSCVT